MALAPWLRRLVGTALLLGFLELLLPEGDLQRFARVVMGLLVLLVLLEPLVGLLHLDFSLDRILSDPAAQASNGADQAGRVTAAGLAALEAARRAEMERSIGEYCAEAAGVRPRGVRVTAGPDGRPRVAVHLDDEAASARLKDLLASHYGLPAAAIEVNGGE